MKAKSILPCLLALLLFSSCLPDGEAVPDQYTDYIGYWKGENGSKIVIDEDGSSAMKMVHRKEGTTITKEGDPSRVTISDEKLVFTMFFGITFEFPIDEAPQQIDGQWRMEVAGLEFTRPAG